MLPQEFVSKWSRTSLKESAASQEHFLDLCRMVGHPTPAEFDPSGETFTFEKGARKDSGADGFADVWYKDHFGWEYKGKGSDLEVAYRQLLQYRDNLANPKLLIVCDFDNIEIHTNFNGTVSWVYTVTLDNLQDSSNPVEILEPTGAKAKTDAQFSGIQVLRACFEDPDALAPNKTTESLTEEAAGLFHSVAESLRVQWGNSDEDVAKFLTRLIFCMFASDVGLLPKDIVTSIANANRSTARDFADRLSALFIAMSTGGWFGSDRIPYFNGGLFSEVDQALMVDSENLAAICQADALNWADIEPSVFGTLFERILNAETRSKLGAHYTSRADIEQIVQPVLMSPLEDEWNAIQDGITSEFASGDTLDEARRESIRSRLNNFLVRLGAVRVLDPACGSGNFLYISLANLKELERKVLGLGSEFDIFDLSSSVHPRQLHGIEANPYAHELASIVVWIGYLQWKHRNGIQLADELPVLQPLNTIQLTDAILDLSDPAGPKEPDWPDAEVIVGNPPFLGGKLLRTNLGDEYVDALFNLYEGRVAAESDLVCYWFEKARDLVEQGQTKRVGLLATQGIRGGANRRVLQRIKETGDIFLAYSDRPWILEGAAVHVSIVGFDDGSESNRLLDGQPVSSINSNLTVGIDLTKARRLKENLGIAFQGPVKVGPFDISGTMALKMLNQPNPHGKSNSEVLNPWVNGMDITGRPRGMWIIDFGSEMPLEEASLFEEPFEYVNDHIKPMRLSNRDKQRRTYWWRLGRSGEDLRKAVRQLKQFIVTPRVSKHRIFIKVSSDTLPDSATVAIAIDDDYTFGVLHSRVHELWALSKGTQLREKESGFRYTPTTTFETFPFPEPPQEQREAISKAADELNTLRENWLNPPGMSQSQVKDRTLTNLYNTRPTWLNQAHQRLDWAVLDAYGWPQDISNEDLLANLLTLNLQREPVA